MREHCLCSAARAIAMLSIESSAEKSGHGKWLFVIGKWKALIEYVA